MKKIKTDSIFTLSECEDILAIPRAYKLGAISGGVVPSYRLVEEGDVAAQWVEDRVDQYVNDVIVPAFDIGNQHFTYTTFLKYKKGFFYKKHSDVRPNVPRKRVASLSIGLDNQYDGGELVFYGADGLEFRRHIATPGVAIAFDSSIEHEVLPITRGIRHVLVTWVSIPSVNQ
jgi:hypothetical protein